RKKAERAGAHEKITSCNVHAGGVYRASPKQGEQITRRRTTVECAEGPDLAGWSFQRSEVAGLRLVRRFPVFQGRRVGSWPEHQPPGVDTWSPTKLWGGQRDVEREYTKEVFPVRKRNFLLSIFVVYVGLTVPRALRAQCMPNSNIHPSSYVPFTSIYYISAPDEAGDLLVVGFMTTGAYSGLSGVPLPDGTNQLFCNPITLAPGIVANAYVPTAAERL